MRVVLDAGAFSRSALFDSGDECFTVPEVLALLGAEGRALAERALSSGKLKLAEPSVGSLRAAERTAAHCAVVQHLRGSELKVLALALDLGALVLSDIFDVQEVAAVMRLPFDGVMRGREKTLNKK